MSGGISLSKESLANALKELEGINTDTLAEIKKIRDNLTIIENNWKGPEHDAAANDKTTAMSCLDEAEALITNVDSSVATLAANASKVTYG